jgi:hypothetical protein
MIIEQHNLFLSENDKSFVITKPKIASRFIQEVYFPNNHEINLSTKLEIDSHEGSGITKEAIDCYNRLFDKKTNTKDIFLIYRNPLTRYISGIIEDILVSIGTSNYNEKFYLRYYLKKNNIEPYALFEKLKSNQYQRDFLLDIEFVNFLNDILSDFFFWQVQTTPINSHHASPYMIIYDKILKSENIDNNKIHLINIDNPTNKLSEILLPYVNDSLKLETATTQGKSQSHRQFHEHIKDVIQTNDFFRDLVDSICDLDFYFYDEFEASSLNVLNRT